jgi:hypothetical protein
VAAQRVGELLHASTRSPATIPEPGPGGRPLGLDPPHQPTQLAHRPLQQVRVGRIVDGPPALAPDQGQAMTVTEDEAAEMDGSSRAPAASTW